MKKIDEIKSLAPFKDKLPEGVSIDLPSVDGHDLTPAEWLAFQMYTQCTTMTECSRRLQEIGIDIRARQLSIWKQTDWWLTLTDASVEWLQEKFYLNVWRDAHHCQTALTKIWKDEWDEQMTANAVVASFRELNRMGKRMVDPLAQNKRDFNLKIIKEEHISIEVIQKNMDLMTPEETKEFSRTGELPDRLQKVVEIEHHPIDEVQDEDITDTDEEYPEQ